MILKNDSNNEMDCISAEDKMRLAFVDLLNQQGVDTGVDVDKVLDEKIEQSQYNSRDDVLDALNYSFKNMEEYSMKQPDYYASNGFSPIDAFKQGLMSKDNYEGFLIGNIIKYVIRANKKGTPLEDLNKAKHYIDFYRELIDTKEEPLNGYGHYDSLPDMDEVDLCNKNRILLSDAIEGLDNIQEVKKDDI